MPGRFKHRGLLEAAFNHLSAKHTIGKHLLEELAVFWVRNHMRIFQNNVEASNVLRRVYKDRRRSGEEPAHFHE
jgi:hypothetical protein